MSKTISNIFFVGISLIVTQIMGGSRAFLLAKLIDPIQYGIWTGLHMIVTLAPIICLGTVEAMLKQVPYFRGRKDVLSIARIENAVLGSVLTAAVLTSCTFIIFYRFIPGAFIQGNLLLVQFMAGTASVSLLTAFYYHRSSAHEDFKTLGINDGLRTIVGFLLVLMGAWKWGVTGAVIGLFVSEVLAWFLFRFSSNKKYGIVRGNINLCIIRNAIKIGLPISIIWWIYGLQASIGRIVIISTMSLEQAGLYGVGASLAMLFSLIPNTIGRVFYPRINAAIGEEAQLQVLRHRVVFPARAISLLMPPLQVMIFFLIPLIYSKLLPKYSAGMQCAQILLLGGYSLGLIRTGANFLIASNKEWEMLAYVLLSLFFNLIGCLGVTILGNGVEGIAISTALASAMLSFLIWRGVFKQLGYVQTESRSFIFQMYLPFIIMIGVISLVKVILPQLSNSPSGEIIEFTLDLTLMCFFLFAFKSTRQDIFALTTRLFPKYKRVALDN